jgi:hypothetical protein
MPKFHCDVLIGHTPLRKPAKPSRNFPESAMVEDSKTTRQKLRSSDAWKQKEARKGPATKQEQLEEGIRSMATRNWHSIEVRITQD